MNMRNIRWRDRFLDRGLEVLFVYRKLVNVYELINTIRRQSLKVVQKVSSSLNVCRWTRGRSATSTMKISRQSITTICTMGKTVVD